MSLQECLQDVEPPVEIDEQLLVCKQHSFDQLSAKEQKSVAQFTLLGASFFPRRWDVSYIRPSQASSRARYNDELFAACTQATSYVNARGVELEQELVGRTRANGRLGLAQEYAVRRQNIVFEAANTFFTRVYNALSKDIHSFIYKKTSDPNMVEDVCQETFLRIYKNIHRFDFSRKISPWAYVIAKNTSFNALNKYSTTSAVTSSLEEFHRDIVVEKQHVPSKNFNQSMVQEAVSDGVCALPDHHREVFVLRELEGFSYEEIASITGIAKGTVKSRLFRAREVFRQTLREHHPEIASEYTY